MSPKSGRRPSASRQSRGIPFFLLTFPLFGWSVFVRSVRRSERDRRQATGMLNEFPRRWRLMFGLIVTAVFVTSLTAMVSLPGQPEYESGSRRYAYNDHGKLIPATRAAYLHAVTVQNRLFLGAALVFTSFAAAITWQERNRRRRDLVTPEGWLRPARPHPKIPLLAAALAVAAAVALAGSIASGTLIYDRLGAYNADGIYLHAGHPVRVLLGPGHYVVYVGCTEETICAQLPLSARRRHAAAAVSAAFTAAAGLPGWAVLGPWRFASAVTGGSLLAANITSPWLVIGSRRFMPPRRLSGTTWIWAARTGCR